VGEAARRTWDPARDWPEVWHLVERWPGLRREHKETWQVLCELAGDRRSAWIDREELRAGIMAIRGKPVADKQLWLRMAGLVRAGLVHFSHDASRGRLRWRIGLHDPRRVPQPTLPPRRPPRLTAGGGWQRTMFDSPAVLRVFRGQGEGETESTFTSRPEQKVLSLPAGSEIESTFTSSPEVKVLPSQPPEAPQGEPAGKPHAGARDHGIIEDQEQIQEHGTIEQYGSMEGPPQSRGPAGRAATDPDGDLRRLEAEVKRQRRVLGVRPDEDAEYSANTDVRQAMARALTAIDSKTPSVVRRELVARINDTVRDPKMDQSIARRVADLVIFHDAPLNDLDRILAAVERARAVGFEENRGPGRLFRYLGEKWSKKLGVCWKKDRPDTPKNRSP
jgi:hypothetical protein